MTLLRSKATRVFYWNGTALSDQTETMRTWSAPYFAPTFSAINDAIYIGRPHKFNFIYLAMNVANTEATTLTLQYWNGSAWVAFNDFLDETEGFKASGFLTWEERPEWLKGKPSAITGLTTLASNQELYWLKLTMSGTPSPTTSIRAMKKILSDDKLMATIHPEILNYLPAGQTDALPQHELAKDIVVNDLIASSVISYEDQIKNADDHVLSASYKTIELILAPIAGDERLMEVKKIMAENYKSTLRKSSAEIDRNKNEDLDETEKEPGFVTHLTR